MLECLALSREAPARPGVFLLHEVSFTLHRGEALAVIGPSGAGKSTLLRLLNRLDEPTSGVVRLNGEDTRAIAPRELRRRVGMVMQRAHLFPGTVAENLVYGPAQHGQTLSPAQIDTMLAQVGLAGYASRDARTLSGGEAQRVALLRALANCPEMLLLDEPTSALDPESRDGVEQTLLSLITAQHLACVWVTHSPEQARVVAARVLALDSGQVRACGSTVEVLA